jgi:hypothetical protein
MPAREPAHRALARRADICYRAFHDHPHVDFFDATGASNLVSGRSPERLRSIAIIVPPR